MPPDPFEVRPEVAAWLENGAPVVALETTLVAHGLPWPRNLETALAMERRVRDEGALPATVGLLAGRVVVGLSRQEIERFAGGGDAAKVSRRDLAAVIASGGLGATTVAATMLAAHRAGIRLLATGGIGGVHRGAEETFDVSADLYELARTPVAVVCAGAKAILDLPRTLEMLETLGVPVVGYGTDRFPGFYARDSGLELERRVDSPRQAAVWMRTQEALGLQAGIVFAQPPPLGRALDRAEVDSLLRRALAAAEAAGVRGKAVTPFLLARLADLSGGRTLEANVELLLANAATAARIAVAYAASAAA